MSFTSGKSNRSSGDETRRGEFGPLPAWDAPTRQRAPQTATPTRVPPSFHEHSETAPRVPAPQSETVLKAIGVVLVLSALIVAVILALPGGDSTAVPTATGGAAVVMAPIETPGQALASPIDELAYDERNSQFTICIDAGHGGDDIGFQRTATSDVPAMDESYFNLSIAKELESRLRARGFLVVMTRSTDQEVNADDFDANNDGQSGAGDSAGSETLDAATLDEMQSRIDRCNDSKADVLVSLHVDGSSDPSVRGSRVWYVAGRPFGQLNQSLAALVYEELEHQMRDVGYPWIGQGIVETGDSVTAGSHAQLQQLLIGPDRKGLKEPSAMPGVVVEVLTLTSDADAAFLASEQGISTIATALDQAIVRFVDASLRGAG